MLLDPVTVEVSVRKARPSIPGYEFVRRGPDGGGWSRSPDLLYVCSGCATGMPASQNDYFTCACGDMYLDVDAFRFGSRKGDSAILTYRRIPGGRAHGHSRT